MKVYMFRLNGDRLIPKVMSLKRAHKLFEPLEKACKELDISVQLVEFVVEGQLICTECMQHGPNKGAGHSNLRCVYKEAK